MQRVLRCSFLVIICCISWTDSYVITVTLIREIGDDIFIECAVDKTPQEGVYMYKQAAASKPQEIFYFYKPKHLTYKTMNESKISVSGALPNLTVTLLKANAEDFGLYWCEFNLEEKTSFGKFTWLWIEKSEEEKKECPEEVIRYEKNLLILFAVISLLGIIGFFCVILKMKGCWGNRKHTPSNPPLDL